MVDGIPFFYVDFVGGEISACLTNKYYAKVGYILSILGR